MITKKRLLTGIFLLSFMFALTMVSATVTFVTPSTTGQSLDGTFIFNVTTDQVGVTYCNWTITDDGHFASANNYTDTVINVSFDTSGLTDAEDTILTVNCSNESTTQTNTLVINIDNTNPVCTSSLNVGEGNIDFMDAFGIYPSQAATDTTDLTYAWTLYDPSGNSQQTSTSATPNFASDDFDEIGDFILGLVVTDEVSKSTTCTNLTISVGGSDNGISTGAIITTLKENKNNLLIGGGVLLIIVFALAGYFIINNQKK